MRKDILVAGFLLSIIDRYKGNILVVCPNSFFTISGYTVVGEIPLPTFIQEMGENKWMER